LPLGSDVIGKLLLIFGISDAVAASISGDALDAMAVHLGSNLAHGTREQIVLAYTIDVEQDLASITAPSLILGATDDNFVDVAHSVHAAQAISGAVLQQMEGGHGLVLERSAEVADAIAQFVGRAGVSSSTI
jgi:pimeloyl-ACP methyl ester carboxylesterase